MALNVVPTEDELRAALLGLRKENPTIGISKLHTQLLSTNSTWAVSEKRTRKVLQSEGLVLSQHSRPLDNRSQISIFPSSNVIESLDVSKWSSRVEVKYFGRVKGKGLVAKELLAAGETVWKEDPFVLAPEWDIYDLQTSSGSCAFCSTPFSSSALVTSCPRSSSRQSCTAHFCNRLCLLRSAKTHPLLCPAQNPASAPLLAFARKNEWMALHALAQCTARILLANRQNDAELQTDWETFCAFAQLGMEDRISKMAGYGAEPDRATWKKAHQLFVQAFQEPPSETEKRKLARLLKKPLRQNIIDELFNYDAFLRGLGRMSLNLEAHGGLYVLHSHINHSCSPNISVRHLDMRSALSRISLVVKQDIEPGEELFVSYVNPDLSLKQRRDQLLEWGFGQCQCNRCMEEEKHTPPGEPGADDFERELKAGLGVM